MHSAWLKITTQAGLNNVQYIKQSSQPVWALLNWTSSSAGRVYQKMHVAEKDNCALPSSVSHLSVVTTDKSLI